MKSSNSCSSVNVLATPTSITNKSDGIDMDIPYPKPWQATIWGESACPLPGMVALSATAPMAAMTHWRECKLQLGSYSAQLFDVLVGSGFSSALHAYGSSHLLLITHNMFFLNMFTFTLKWADIVVGTHFLAQSLVFPHIPCKYRISRNHILPRNGAF